MHELGSRIGGAGSGFRARDGFRFLAVSLVITLLLLASGILTLRFIEADWFGVLLLFCALILAYLVPFLRGSVIRYLGSAGPRP